MNKTRRESSDNEMITTGTSPVKDKGKGMSNKAILPVLILLEILAVVYDALANQSRIIRPMDFSTYSFRLSDLPLMAMTAIFVAYVFYTVIRTIIYQIRNGGRNDARMTRKLNPHFGWFGFAGLLGFMGIPAYMLQQQVWPFFFFVFFGFFGFFYEGKLSSTLMDERFKEEQSRASLKAYKTGFGLLWLVTWLTGIAGSHLSAESVAVIFSVASSLIIALVLFLSNYLLYKYDTEEPD